MQRGMDIHVWMLTKYFHRTFAAGYQVALKSAFLNQLKFVTIRRLTFSISCRIRVELSRRSIEEQCKKYEGVRGLLSKDDAGARAEQAIQPKQAVMLPIPR